eukprot:m.221405 g.221405  ORF g.221405 m.221405 type:complete len:307 (+) comp39959_c0_seq46:688-1608(+)
MYDEDGNYKVTDMLEVYGVLSVDPALAQLASSSDEGQGDVSTFGSMELQEEVAAHSPPPSLVPRIHVVHAVRLQHSHPLITDPPTSAGEQAVVQSILSDALRIRENFIGCLSHILMGDAMAAEYLFLHLLSGVYARKDMVALGKFSLNLSGCPDSVLTQKIYELINAVTPKSYKLSLTLENLNSFQFCPKKDYSANCLKSGILQLTDSTCLVVDEIALAAGHLETSGVQNLTALGSVIRWQKVEYDFSFHNADFPCNIIVLVFSEGKSMLPCLCGSRLFLMKLLYQRKCCRTFGFIWVSLDVWTMN